MYYKLKMASSIDASKAVRHAKKQLKLAHKLIEEMYDTTYFDKQQLIEFHDQLNETTSAEIHKKLKELSSEVYHKLHLEYMDEQIKIGGSLVLLGLAVGAVSYSTNYICKKFISNSNTLKTVEDVTNKGYIAGLITGAFGVAWLFAIGH